MIIVLGDPTYSEILQAYVRQGRPAITLYLDVAYERILDSETLSFAVITRTNATWLDPQDPSGRWHNAYGYTPKEE